MISKEKRKEYIQRYDERYPGRRKEQWQKWWSKKKIKELTEKTKEQNALIKELQQKLEKAESNANLYQEKFNKTSAAYALFKEDIGWVLSASVSHEEERAQNAAFPNDKEKYLYGKSVSERLLNDFKTIERKHKE